MQDAVGVQEIQAVHELRGEVAHGGRGQGAVAGEMRGQRPAGGQLQEYVDAIELSHRAEELNDVGMRRQVGQHGNLARHAPQHLLRLFRAVVAHEKLFFFEGKKSGGRGA